MNVFFDTEFTELSKNGELISIGLIGYDETKRIYKTFYAEFTDYNKEGLSDFVKDNVLPNLFTKDKEFTRSLGIKLIDNFVLPTFRYGSKGYIKESLIEWLQEFNDDIYLVSDVAHYDMVLFIDLFGTAFDLPKMICPAVYDINNDIMRFYHCNLKDAFDKTREEIVEENIDKVDDNIRSIYRLLDKEYKHNSLFDAIVIYTIYMSISK